jgi:hypothetical protein
MEAIRRTFIRPLDGKVALACVAILILNMVDAFATLRHLEYGAEELNPFMQAMLRRGAEPFLFVKHLLASVGVIGIALYPERRAAQVALWILLPVYAALGLYQLGLFYIV